VDLLLESFLQARADSGKACQLHIYGAFNAERSFAEHLKHLAGDSPDIIFHGSYEHRRALALMHELDAIVVPSLWYENSPRVILEAFAAQRPVIGTRAGGIAEVVRDGVNGLLFERGNRDDLARVLGRALDDPALLKGLAQNVEPPRTLEQDMLDVLDVYQRVVALSESNPEPAR
jgi:glycosyltransferase involved in cell wall biosynthesis